MRAIALLLFSSLAAVSVPAAAQDIPGRAGRLAWFEGNVALYQDPDRGWDEAFVNSPITSENSVWTDSGARAELQVAAIALRLDEMSQLDVSRLDDEILDATLEQGVLAVRIRHLRPSDVVRISTRMASFRLSADGRYRIDADPDGHESRISVFSGAASLETASGPVRIRAGQSIVVWGEGRPAYAFEDASPTDFDGWALARDERWIERRAPEYVSYEMTGYEDLDAWGAWAEDPVYGVVWFPNRVAADWAPYRYGRWVYVRPWGWTWIDAEPWGYAPFHYGRWAHIGGRWAWCPGRRVARPVWAPALVGFIGGSDWSVGATSGGPSVGWYPLAPSERYRPWYRASRAYENQVNVTLVSVPERVAREHQEWNRDRAATVVPRATLVEQRPVAQARIDVSQQALRRAPTLTAPAVALPSHAEVREAHRAQPAARPSTPRPPIVGGAPAIGGREAAVPEAPARPRFAKPRVAPQRAAAGAKPPPANPAARTPVPSPTATQPAAQPRRPEGGREAAPREAPPRAEQEGRRTAQPAQGGNAAQERARQEQQRATQEQQRTQAAREAQQRAAQEQQRAQAAKEAQQRAAQEQQRAQATKEAQQRAAQEQQRRRKGSAATRAQEQQRAQAAKEAQQRAAQEQQRAQAAKEAQQRAAQEQQRAQAAKEAQQRAAQEQQRAQAAKEAQQRAAQEQQRAQAAKEAQQRAAQEQQRAAQEQQRAKAAREAQQRAAQQQQRAPRGHEATGNAAEKEKEKEKEREKGDQGGPH